MDAETYLRGLPEDAQAALRALRGIVISTVPDAVEGFSYGMPAYKYRGKPLVYFGAAKDHLALYGNNVRFVADDPRIAEYVHSKGAIRFTSDRPLPQDLVVAILRARVAEIDA